MTPFRALEPCPHRGVRLGVVIRVRCWLSRAARSSSLARLRLMEVAIAGFAAAGAGLAGASSLAGDGVAGSGSSVGGAVASALPRFRTTAGTSSATAFRFFGGGL